MSRPVRGKKRGAAAVEFGLLLIPLMLILMGIVDYGFAFFTEIQLANAAREGARAAAVGDDGQASAQERLTSAGLDRPATVTVSTVGDEVRVNIDYDFEPLVGFVPLPNMMTSRVVMRLEGGGT